MANLSNINNKFLVTTGGNVLIGQTSAVGSSIFQVSGEALFGNGTNGLLLSYSNGNSSGIIDTGHSSTALEFRVGNTQELLINGSSATFAGTVIGTIARFDTLNNNANSKNIIYRNSSSTNTVVGGGSSPDKIYIQDNGNVGIGTSLPGTKLEVKMNDTANNRLGFTGDGSTTGSAMWTNWQTGNSYLDFRLGGTTDTYTKMRITSDGKVGIGTDSPTYKLHVDNRAAATTATQSPQLFLTGGSNIGTDYRDGQVIFGSELGTSGSLGWSNASAGVFLDNRWNNNIGFIAFRTKTSGTPVEVMRLTGPGNVGIATTAPGNKFVVRGLSSDGTGGDNNVAQFEGPSGTNGFQVFVNDTNNNTGIQTKNGDALIINPHGGNVGIGHTTPQFGLTMAQGSGDANRIGWEDSSNYKRASIICSSSSDALQFHTGTSDTERMRINSSGQLTVGGPTNTRLVTTITENSKVDLNVTDGTSTARALSFSTGGTARVFIDANGSIYNNSGTGQTFFGSNNAGNPSSVTGASNSSFGYGAGNALTSGTQNVNIGRDAGGALTTGLNNVSIGTNAGFSNTDGQQNVYVGSAAGYTSPGQNYNTFVGYESGHNNQANENTAVGRLSLHANTSGNRNVGIGFNALRLNTTGVANTALGALALENNVDGDSNTALGYQAADANTTGDANTAIGTNSLGANSTGSRNTTVGNNSGLKITGSDTVAIGYEALAALTSNGQNVGIGVNAGLKFTGSRLVAIGYGAGKELLSDVDNVFIGQQAGENRTTGTDNTFIGAYANYSAGTGCCNTGVGKSTGYSLTSGVQNTFVGRQAGYSVTDGANNTMVGHNTGVFVTGSDNTYVGSYAGDASSSSGSYNTGIGRAGLSALTSGTYHTALGYNAGDEITTGTNCTAIGHAAGSGSSPRHMTTNSNEIVIGNNSIVGAYIRVAWTTGSDKRDKINFDEVPYGLEFVNKLKPTSYNLRKEREKKEIIGNRKYGFIAQEILELEGDNPVIIDNSDENKLCYQESNLIPVLVKAIQELKAEIELLKNK